MALHDSWVEAERHLRIIPRNIELLIFATIQPIMFVVLFVYVFGGAIEVPGFSNYDQFLIPGIFSQSLVFGSAFTGIGIAEDSQKGLVDRLRSLPMSRSAVLIGRTVSDLVRNVITFFVMLAVVVLADRLPLRGLAGEAVLGHLAAAPVQLRAQLGAGADGAVGRLGRSRQLGRVHLDVPADVRVVGVRRPRRRCPSWLQPIADANPFTIVTNAARALYNGNPVGNDAMYSIAVVGRHHRRVRHAVASASSTTRTVA